MLHNHYCFCCYNRAIPRHVTDTLSNFLNLKVTLTLYKLENSTFFSVNTNLETPFISSQPNFILLNSFSHISSLSKWCHVTDAEKLAHLMSCLLQPFPANWKELDWKQLLLRIFRIIFQRSWPLKYISLSDNIICEPCFNTYSCHVTDVT